MAMRATCATQSLVMMLGPRVSPAITTWLVVASVSQATRSCQGSTPAFGPSRKNRSTTSSEIRSQTLSGCPSDTDSLVNKYDLRTLAFPSDGWMATTVNGGDRKRFLQCFQRGSSSGQHSHLATLGRYQQRPG
jgi:hypothetical protein